MCGDQEAADQEVPDPCRHVRQDVPEGDEVVRMRGLVAGAEHVVGHRGQAVLVDELVTALVVAELQGSASNTFGGIAEVMESHETPR